MRKYLSLEPGAWLSNLTFPARDAYSNTTMEKAGIRAASMMADALQI
jgi:hypothetical protein